MYALVRALLDRDVEVEGARHLIRSPIVREALTLLASYQGVLAGQQVQREVFFETLRGWLPDPLYKLFTSGDCSENRVVAYVFQIVNEGVPQFKQRIIQRDKKEIGDRVGDDAVHWDAVVAEYMAMYGCSLNETMKEPWNGFLLMSGRVDMVTARQSLRQLMLAGIPYIKNDKERDEALEDLRERAGFKVLTPEEKRAQALANQQSQLDRLADQFRSVGAFSSGNPEA